VIEVADPTGVLHFEVPILWRRCHK